MAVQLVQLVGATARSDISLPQTAAQTMFCQPLEYNFHVRILHFVDELFVVVALESKVCVARVKSSPVHDCGLAVVDAERPTALANVDVGSEIS